MRFKESDPKETEPVQVGTECSGSEEVRTLKVRHDSRFIGDQTIALRRDMRHLSMCNK